MDAPVVGTAETWQILKAPQRLANGTSTGYGLGLMSGRYRGHEMLFHSGGLADGGSSQMLKVPAAGFDVVVLVNRADTAAALLAEHVLDACLAKLDPVRQASRERFAAGTFHSPATSRVVQLFAKGGQQIVAIDGVEMTVEPDDDGTLRPAGIWKYANARQAVTLQGDRARPDFIQLSDFGNVDELLPVLPTRNPDAKTIAGHYRSATIGVDAVISATDRGACLSARGRFGASSFDLECLADGIWRCHSTSSLPVGGMLLFDGDGAAFRFSSARVQALPFRRCG